MTMPTNGQTPLVQVSSIRQPFSHKLRSSGLQRIGGRRGSAGSETATVASSVSNSLISSRILAFGPDYGVTINDPNENEPVEVKVDMSQLKIKEIDESKLNRNNEYEFILPKTKTPIKFKIMTHGDEIAVNKDIEASEKITKQGNDIQARYRRLITEINGNREVGYISNYVANQLLAADSKALRKHISEMSPDVDLNFDYTSPFTGETEALKVPLGINFFYPAD